MSSGRGASVGKDEGVGQALDDRAEQDGGEEGREPRLGRRRRSGARRRSGCRFGTCRAGGRYPLGGKRPGHGERGDQRHEARTSIESPPRRSANVIPKAPSFPGAFGWRYPVNPANAEPLLLPCDV